MKLVSKKFSPIIDTLEENMCVTFDKLRRSIATIKGRLTNVSIREDLFIKDVEAVGKIAEIHCNFGKKVNPAYSTGKPVKKSNKGRKPLPKPKAERKLQGDGSSMNSQISFWVMTHRIFKVKLYRTGSIQVPDCRDRNFNDVREVLEILGNYLSGVLKTDVHYEDLFATMINYCISANSLIDLTRTYETLLAERKEKYHYYFEDVYRYLIQAKSFDPDRMFAMLDVSEYKGWYTTKTSLVKKVVRVLEANGVKLSQLSETDEETFEKIKNELRATLMRSKHNIVAQIRYLSERYSGLCIRLRRPYAHKPDKQLTIKIFGSGKINIDAALSDLDAYWAAAFIKDFFYRHPHLTWKEGQQRVVDVSLDDLVFDD
ncbi:hypothetical protein BNJ_00081 [Kaumoebavirus]|uniref:hypothetical protein n=1 Tax=Kaumoebavirus TaxID=1859492 RepID=UPI0009C20EEF|nr:hypothetical protein BNJ_00081 [Kaumoebavirus]ARA71921.1 hypothetical protein BNJ_00081 [Kaumoebavirus]